MEILMPESRFEHLPFVVLPDYNLIVVRAKGTLHFEDLVRHVDDFMKHEDFQCGMNVLYDMSEVESLTGQLQPLLESAESLNCSDFIPVPAKTVFFTNNHDSTTRLLEGFCIMTRYTRLPHFIAEAMEDVFDILGMPQLPEIFEKSRLG